MRRVLPLLLLLAACGGSDPEPAPAPTPEPTAGEEAPVAEVTIPSGDLAAAIAGEHRSEENRARDAYRHPLETLQFFGIEPSMRVIEVRPGRGWYTEILAPYLRGEGQLIAAVPSADGERARYRQRFVDFTQTMPELYGDIELVTFEPPSPIRLGPDGSVDAVVTFRNTHNWIGDNGAREAYEAFFRVLRPGGVLGVVQHRASDSAGHRGDGPQRLRHRAVHHRAVPGGRLRLRGELGRQPQPPRPPRLPGRGLDPPSGPPPRRRGPRALRGDRRERPDDPAFPPPRALTGRGPPVPAVRVDAAAARPRLRGLAPAALRG
jgi:predicted methyltransferase